MGKRLLAAGLTMLFLGSCGGGGGGSSSSSDIFSNSSPAFSSSISFSVVENNTAAGIIEADDADSNDTLALSIEGGADADLFELGVCNASRCTSNSLSFKIAPNFEAPGDATGDNIYEVTLGAYDGTVTVTQDVSITVTNAVEGRVVDAPLSGASMCVDQDEDWECDVQPDDVACPEIFPPGDNCFTEPSGTSDAQGYYSLAEGQEFPDQELRILSIGGTDILTNKELPSLALIAEIPTDASQAIAVTPLSTVVSIATDPAATLVALGFPDTVTPEQITSIDPWALATDSTESSGEFASSAVLAQSIGIATTELESVADNVVTTSVQIANLIQTADALVTDTTTSGVQNAAERAAMISSTVTQELVETIDAAVVSAGSAAAASVDLGDAAVTNEVLKETAEESATLIVAEIEAKQTAGTLDLSDTNDVTVAAILQIVETQELITSTGLDSTQTANIAAIATTAAETNALIKTQVASAGVSVLTTTSSAEDIAGIVNNTSTLAKQLVTGGITTDTFSSSSDVDTQAAASDQLNVAPSIDLTALGSISENATLLGSVVASDSDGDTLTFSISGTDADKFKISTEGELRLIDPADYEVQSVYSVTVSVSDGQQTVSEDLSIFVTTTPTLNISGLGSIAENATLLGSVIAGDEDGDSLTFSISGTDADKFIISTEGELRLIDPADYEVQSVYSVTVSVSDGQQTVSEDLSIFVTTTPTLNISGLGSIAENATLLGSVVAGDEDGDSLTFSISGTDADKFIISTEGELRLIDPADYEVQSVYSVTVSVSDGQQTVSEDLSIFVTTTPTLNISGLGSIAENATLLGSVVASDADGDTLTFSISGTDADKFIISSEGELSLVAAADYEAQTTYNVIISVSDGSETVSKSITVDVTNVIETPPSLTLASTISVAENTTVVTQASATDPEGSDLGYALSGTDAETFYISSTGLVSFRAAPDYESLTGTQFTFTVIVTNAGGLTATGNVTVNVTDVAENFFDTCQFGECRFE